MLRSNVFVCFSFFPVWSQILTVQDSRSSPHILPGEAVGREIVSDRAMSHLLCWAAYQQFLTTQLCEFPWWEPGKYEDKVIGSAEFRTVCFHCSHACWLLYVKWEKPEEQISNLQEVFCLFYFVLLVVGKHYNFCEWEAEATFKSVCPRKVLICPSGYCCCLPNSCPATDWILPHSSFLLP